MSFDDLISENILIYAIKMYDHPTMILSEFKEDYKRFNYLKKLFKRYRKHSELREQLILNHLVIIFNVFGIEAASRLIFFKLNKEDYPALKTYLIFLCCMPEVIKGIRGQDIISSDIPVDMYIANTLRNFK